ncbi:ROK family protein [Streptomyces sp. H27-D2]|uniref:ROK family protein n=1 Tax=Streptomyces sp. H27-D2 TaxID=3046304 RepID=UPI002DBD9AA9|nr:ROK family protein [Streptomyces sp. H27-D2]MEC4016776.1 ROK family protein [Streptomyces sp. H27-D2]
MSDRNQRTVRDLRRTSRSAVLRRLFFEGPVSREELRSGTGLSSGSISNVVSELVAEGLVEDAGSVESDGGRPRTLLRVAPASGYLIGVDVGETRVRVELFDMALNEIARTERPLVARGYDVDRIVDHIGQGVGAVLRDADVFARQLFGVGVGVPGIVDRGSPDGAVVHCQTIGWDAVPLEALLRRRVELPADVAFFIDNGANTLGRAEMWFGAGRGAKDAVIALIGSGVGACVITDGAPYGGANSSAGEWGHTTLQIGGRRCRCGARGCLEAYVGAEALLDRWARPRGAGGAGGGGGAGGAEVREQDDESGLTALLAAADAQDPSAVEVLDETALYLGVGIANLVNLFNPERILLCGWAGLLLGPRLLPEVRRVAVTHALRHPAERTTIKLGRLGPDAVTLGAATLPLADFFTRGGSRAGARRPRAVTPATAPMTLPAG